MIGEFLLSLTHTLFLPVCARVAPAGVMGELLLRARGFVLVIHVIICVCLARVQGLGFRVQCQKRPSTVTKET